MDGALDAGDDVELNAEHPGRSHQSANVVQWRELAFGLANDLVAPGGAGVLRGAVVAQVLASLALRGPKRA